MDLPHVMLSPATGKTPSCAWAEMRGDMEFVRIGYKIGVCTVLCVSLIFSGVMESLFIVRRRCGSYGFVS